MFRTSSEMRFTRERRGKMFVIIFQGRKVNGGGDAKLKIHIQRERQRFQGPGSSETQNVGIEQDYNLNVFQNIKGRGRPNCFLHVKSVHFHLMLFYLLCRYFE